MLDEVVSQGVPQFNQVGDRFLGRLMVLEAHLEALRRPEHGFGGRLVVGCDAGDTIHRSCNDNERFEEPPRQ